MNRAAFEVYIETQLLPCLQPGEVVIADNLSSHKFAVAQALLKAQENWLLFLPPYSPENGGGILGHSSVGIKRSRAAKKSATFAFSVLGRAWGYLLWNCI